MIDNIEQALHFLRKNAEKYAKAKATRVYLQEFRKSKKAILMVHAEQTMTGKSTVSERENYAYAHDEYVELLQGLRVAVEEEERLSLLVESSKLAIEVWRTEQANNRAERQAYN